MRMSSRTVWAFMAVAAGAGLAAMFLPASRTRRVQPHDEHTEDDSRVDDASADSFPASDPPSFSVPTSPQVGDLPPVRTTSTVSSPAGCAIWRLCSRRRRAGGDTSAPPPR